VKALLLLSLGALALGCAASDEEDLGASGDSVNAGEIVGFHELTFDRYHSQAEIHQFLQGEALKHPEFVSFATLGVSRQNREIAYVVISNREPASQKAFYFNGTHHGDEWSSTEGILALADYLIGHRDEPRVRAILDQYAIYLQPLVNPDGHQVKTRVDSQGNDPNRDYAYTGEAGEDAFHLPEIRLVRDLVDRIHPRAAAAYHSGIQEVLWPWCYTALPPAAEESLAGAGKAAADAMHFDRYLQSYDDYPTTGEFIDYAYMKYGTAALTFEVSTAKTPSVSQLDGVVKNSVRGALAFIDAVRAEDLGAPKPVLAPRPPEGRGNQGAMGRRVGTRLE
jgi:hypothetical protein